MYVLFIRFISEYLIFFLILPFVYFLTIKDWKTIRNILLAVIIAWILREIASILWYEPRPFIIDSTKLLYHTSLTAKNGSFFSGHASTAMAMACGVYWGYKKTGLILIVLAIIVGIGRFLAGLHYPIDVVVGLFVGFLVSYQIKSIMHRIDI